MSVLSIVRDDCYYRVTIKGLRKPIEKKRKDERKNRTEHLDEPYRLDAQFDSLNAI